MKWESKTLGEICTFRSGVGFKLEYQGDKDGDYPFIKVSDMNLSENQRRINTANNWISGTVRERIGAEPFHAGTTVFAKIGEALKQNRVRLLVRDTIIDNNMMGAIPKLEVVEAEFLYHRLSMFDFAATSSGAALPFLTVKVLAESRVSIPPLPVQRGIADVLSTYDELMENNRRRMTLLEDAARLLYREWFVRLRFPGHEHARRANGIPQGWERLPTPEAVEINPTTKLSDEEEHWYVEMADLPTDSMVIQSAIRRDGRSGSKFRNGDTLLARITPCLENGKTGFVNFMADGEAGRGSTEFIVLRSKRLTPEFVYCLARTYNFRENAIKSMVGSSGRQLCRKVALRSSWF